MNAAKRYIISCSFGKDSLATILLAKKHGEPLDEAVYCEVMFDKTISGEVPEHRDFIYTRGIPALERMGIKTFFASNACCAYDREKFWFQGGFITKTIFNCIK